MSQSRPHVPLVSDASCWSSDTQTETEISPRLYRSSHRSEGGRCVSCPLRPAPLFRSVGLTGLSASLPPHRRLRSILHRARAVQPDDANANENSSAQGGADANTLVPKELPCKDFLPDIMTQKLRETRIRGRRSIGDTETFSSLANNLTETSQRRYSMGQREPPLKTYTRRRTVVFPLTTTETPSSDGRKRWSRRIRRILTSEKGSGEQDISESFYSLVITDDHPSAKNLQASGFPTSDKRDLDSVHKEKGGCHTRRDRRPHFLPPISQSGCLLDVPFVLPENSPPPSPSSVFSTTFFPLCVPPLPVCPQRRHRDT